MAIQPFIDPFLYTKDMLCKCGNKKDHWYDEICWRCIKDNKRKKRQAELNEIAFQDIDTRLRNIEAYIYDQQHNSNPFGVMR